MASEGRGPTISKPIVLVGSGKNHYKFIQSLTSQAMRPIVVVGTQPLVFPRENLPMVLAGVSSVRKSSYDLWSACQRTGAYYINDHCININYEDQIVYLKRYGELSYHKLSVETQSQAASPYSGLHLPPSIFKNQKPTELLEGLQAFCEEVRRHCPKELRIVITGLSRESLDLAFVLNEKIQSSCGRVDIVLIENPDRASALGGLPGKNTQKLLAQRNIRILCAEGVEKISDHRMTLLDGQSFSFDILIPNERWQSTDYVGRLLQSNAQQIWVGRDLRSMRDDHVFVVGDNVQFHQESGRPRDYRTDQLTKILSTNLLMDDEKTENLDEAPPKWMDRPYLKRKLWGKTLEGAELIANWAEEWKATLAADRKLPLLDHSEHAAVTALTFEANHMSRPWQGRGVGESRKELGRLQMISSNGFNTWGSFARSAERICELALLKATVAGINPEQLRFHLSLPRHQPFLTDHIFQATFRAIEEVTERHQIPISGGDTYDADHWHLSVTIGGPVAQEPAKPFASHDYLILTQPLGFGFLWSGRLMDGFSSEWVEKTWQSSILPDFKQWNEFLNEMKPSGNVLIEEWGFLYHVLQKLPADQQLTLNFREIPRWKGTDQTAGDKLPHPGMDANWQKISGDVAFAREDVSVSNSVLWDSLSQGGLVIGVKPDQCEQALSSLKKMGYKRAALVGCVRPKHGRSKVILSDWMPH